MFEPSMAIFSEDEFGKILEALEEVGVKLTNKQYEKLKEILVI